MTRPYIPARPTLYKGIQMRSRLEASWAQWWDEGELPWAYEPVCFASEVGQYLPDFRVDLPHRAMYVEIKPFEPAEAEVFTIQDRMEIIWASDPRSMLCLEFGRPEDDEVWTHWVGFRLGEGRCWRRELCGHPRAYRSSVPIADTAGKRVIYDGAAAA